MLWASKTFNELFPTMKQSSKGILHLQEKCNLIEVIKVTHTLLWASKTFNELFPTMKQSSKGILHLQEKCNQ